MTSEITYLGNLRCKASHLASGMEIFTDAPVDNHGKGEAFSPTDLVSTGLGLCLLTIMGVLAQREEIALEGTRASIQKIMLADPRRIGEIITDIYFPPLFISEKQKIMLERAARSCPVALSLHPDLLQTIRFHYAEENL